MVIVSQVFRYFFKEKCPTAPLMNQISQIYHIKKKKDQPKKANLQSFQKKFSLTEKLLIKQRKKCFCKEKKS